MWLYVAFVVVIVIFLSKEFFQRTLKEGFDSNTITLEEFNKKYDADLVGLPPWLFALGVEGGKYQTFSKIELYGETLVEYWMEHYAPSLPKHYAILCPMDGMGTSGDISEELVDKEITSGMIQTLNSTPYLIPELKNSLTISEGRNEYPVFHSNRVLYAMCSNVNDHITVLIPDAHFIREKAYQEKKEEIDKNRIPYSKRKSECIWRGNLNNGHVDNFMKPHGKTMNPRKYFQKLHLEGRFPKVNFENKDTSISDQIQYKMILDMDGWSSTWSATVWKMYSGSVLLKTKSKWKQWYYHKLEPWVHYVPVKDDFSDLNDKIEWCLHNERECIKITENAKRFVDKHLTWDQVKKDTLAAVRSSIV
jgi:hypothetical protein